ncbi:MAG: hypothetical protein PHV82_01475 [Victivallaceae bacterium]|nr:hypothetical protein [Victivallaceae bacterium]
MQRLHRLMLEAIYGASVFKNIFITEDRGKNEIIYGLEKELSMVFLTLLCLEYDNRKFNFRKSKENIRRIVNRAHPFPDRLKHLYDIQNAINEIMKYASATKGKIKSKSLQKLRVHLKALSRLVNKEIIRMEGGDNMD